MYVYDVYVCICSEWACLSTLTGLQYWAEFCYIYDLKYIYMKQLNWISRVFFIYANVICFYPSILLVLNLSKI